MIFNMNMLDLIFNEREKCKLAARITKDQEEDYDCGFKDAIMFADRVNRAIGLCDHCGALIESNMAYYNLNSYQLCATCYNARYGTKIRCDHEITDNILKHLKHERD